MSDDFLERFEQRRREREQADRSFTLLGETLTFRASIAPEATRRLADVRERWASDLTEAQKRLQAANGTPPDLSDLALNVDEIVDAADEQILACLEPDSREAWARLRALDADNPLNFQEIGEIADWLLGRVTGLPTSAPSDSSAGRTKTASKSKGASSSRASSRRR